MTRILKRVAIVVLVLALAGFVAFLYFIPPFTVAPPETFSQAQLDMLPKLDGIADPAVRTIAERGRYLVLTSDCAGCHGTPGPENAVPSMYLAGGMRFQTATHGETVSRNLTPHPTGLGSRSDAEIMRALRGGMRGGTPGGRAMSHTAMPWPVTAGWTEEDLYAVITYLRHIPPVQHHIPEPTAARPANPQVFEAAWGGKDAGRR